MSSTLGPFQLRNFQGTQSSPWVDVPQGTQQVAISFTGLTQQGISVETDVEYSPDGGTTILPEGGASFVTGGTDHNGNPITTFSTTSDFPSLDGAPSPKTRGTLTVTGGKITANVSVTFLP